jgi:putative holliday junction resolvase
LSGVATFLAFDFGRLKTGVAVGNSLTCGAEALTIVRSSDSATRLLQISKLIEQWQPQALVVGLPTHPDGKPLPNTLACQKFARQLSARFRLPVHMVDERLSTREAIGLLKARQKSARSATEDDDAEAAAVILRQYWSEHEVS